MEHNEHKPVSVGDWLFTLIILGIPLLGIVMLLVWIFSSNTHPSKKTFAQASLILVVVAGLLALVLVAALSFLGTAAHIS